MTDNELITFIANRLDLGVIAGGWDYPVVQKNQPTQQGIPSDPTVFIEKTLDIPRGWPMVSDVKRDTDYAEVETQLYETTVIISALVRQNPADTSLPTASDVVNFLKLYMNSRNTIQTFTASGVSVLRITEVDNPYFEDDTHRFAADPSFSVVVTHNRQITFAVPAAIKATEILVKGV